MKVARRPRIKVNTVKALECFPMFYVLRKSTTGRIFSGGKEEVVLESLCEASVFRIEETWASA